ncbi:MAG: SUMF1/EgtB/PvdO family nonheme iron enzyme [Anaerolineae bacterium]|nr:SUMF1/EgtB/PvdO family nonheme iron enzyme [Anaerolineae bacterium]
MINSQEKISQKKLGFLPEMVHIPAGEFLMGSDPQQDVDAKADEQPQHMVYLPQYMIARTSITNVQYSVFLLLTRRAPPLLWRLGFLKYRLPPLGKWHYPVVYVSWYDAMAYCRWLSKVTGQAYTLPNEPEWEKAARGPDGQIYPWGNVWDAMKCNSSETNTREVATRVDAYPGGISPYGVLDMVGNVWEWTRSLWGKDLAQPDFGYPYDAEDGREDMTVGNNVRRVLRGVSFYNDRRVARCAARYRYSPHNHYNSVGFRVVSSSTTTKAEGKRCFFVGGLCPPTKKHT